MHNQHCVLRDFLQFSFGRLHNATYPLLLLYFWEGYPSVRYYSRIPYISLSYVFFAISTQGMPEQFFIILRFLRYIDGAYSLGIPHILFFWRVSCGERWEGGIEGICQAFWMEAWHVATLCQNMSKGIQKKHTGEIHFKGGNYFQVVPPNVVKPSLTW